MNCAVWWTRTLSRFDIGWRITCHVEGGMSHPVYAGRDCWRSEAP